MAEPAAGSEPLPATPVAAHVRKVLGLTILRGRTRGELSGADLFIAPPIGESGWGRPQRIPQFARAGEEAIAEDLRRLLEEKPLREVPKTQAG